MQSLFRTSLIFWSSLSWWQTKSLLDTYFCLNGAAAAPQSAEGETIGEGTAKFPSMRVQPADMKLWYEHACVDITNNCVWARKHAVLFALMLSISMRRMLLYVSCNHGLVQICWYGQLDPKSLLFHGRYVYTGGDLAMVVPFDTDGQDFQCFVNSRLVNVSKNCFPKFFFWKQA